MVVNAVEAEMMGAAHVVDLDSAERAAQHFVQRLGAAVVVTAGSHGAAWAQPGGAAGRVASEPVKVVSTLGAGDAFIGHLVASLVRGSALSEAVVSANRAAAKHISGAV